MLQAIINSIINRYHVKALNDIVKIIGLHVFIALGLLTGLIMFYIDMVGSSNNACLPGDLSILIIFGMSLYGLRISGINWAVYSIFLVPVIPYFFFISSSSAILPTQQSVINTLWSLIPFFLFFLFFSKNRLHLSIFFLLSLLTLGLHVYSTNQTELFFRFKWEPGVVVENPFITLTLSYLIFLAISWNFQSTINELTDEKEDTERLINQTIRNLPQGMMLLEIVKDEFGTPSHLTIRKTNIAFERLFKITSRELKDQKADDVLPKVFRNSFDWNKQYMNSKNNHFSLYLERLNKYFEVDTFKMNNDHIISLFVDVTNKQQTINALQDSQHRYQVLLEAIPDLFFIIDQEGTYVDFVFKASETLKIKPDDIIGNTIFEVGFSEKMSSKIMQCIQACIQFDSIETIEYALEVEEASAMFEMRIVKLNDNSVISLARDISKRKQAELKIEEARKKAEEADQLKTAFLANISHEIRTPMNAIIGFSRMIGSPEFDDDEKSKFVEIIINNGKLLLTLINDMISLSKIESNTLVVKTAPCRINDLMVTLYKEYSYDIDEMHEIKLKVSCSNSNSKFTIMTDPVLLQSVLQKMIDNGIKFTEQGEVEFGYRILTNQIEFFVRDTGIGIATHDQERIFERFHQLDNRTTRSYEGTGLGLSIAQHYVRLLGGTLQVDSALGKGSIFTFTIPYTKEESPLKIVR